MIVVKLGGAALKASLSDPELFRPFREVKEELLILHGGGPAINQLAQKLNVPSEFVDGQRVTSPELMTIVEMVLTGSINPVLVRGLQSVGLRACGISGVDDSALECVEENPKLGLVGRVHKVHGDWIQTALNKGLVPVLSPVGVFQNGKACNVNADLAAASVASHFKARRLLFLTDKDGILDASGQALSQMTKAELEKLNETPTISGGMKVKVRAILEFLNATPSSEVLVMNGLDAKALTSYFKGSTFGTSIS